MEAEAKRKTIDRAVIGIVPRYSPIMEHFEIPEAFTNPIMGCGAIPLLIPYTEDQELLDCLLGQVDGLMHLGGLDVDPALYTYGPRHPEVSVSIPHYDRFEFGIMQWAFANGIPTLGICRGMQVMNVCFGGNLLQDLSLRSSYTFNHYQLRPFDIPRHDIEVVEGSRLAEVIGAGEHWVNSMHHQSVLTVPEPFEIVARSSDGLVEAIEVRSHPMFIGVQWHPEDMRGDMSLEPFIEEMIALSSKAR